MSSKISLDQPNIIPEDFLDLVNKGTGSINAWGKKILYAEDRDHWVSIDKLARKVLSSLRDERISYTSKDLKTLRKICDRITQVYDEAEKSALSNPAGDVTIFEKIKTFIRKILLLIQRHFSYESTWKSSHKFKPYEPNENTRPFLFNAKY